MYLFDTNILSEVMKKRPAAKLLEQLARVPGNLQFTSCITVMELRYGSSRRSDHELFWKRIDEEVLSRVRILPITVQTALIAGDIAASLSLLGRGISPEDLLIASTALADSLTLVTANEKHFKYIPGLKLENWLK